MEDPKSFLRRRSTSSFRLSLFLGKGFFPFIGSIYSCLKRLNHFLNIDHIFQFTELDIHGSVSHCFFFLFLMFLLYQKTWRGGAPAKWLFSYTWKCRKYSEFSMHVFPWDLGCFYCFGLFDVNAWHQPVKLTPCKILCLGSVPRTPVGALGSQPFVDHVNAIRFFQDRFVPGAFTAAEKKPGMVNLHRKLILNDGTQSINWLPHICPTTDGIDCCCINTGNIC